jgi:hypothetical protein
MTGEVYICELPGLSKECANRKHPHHCGMCALGYNKFYEYIVEHAAAQPVPIIDKKPNSLQSTFRLRKSQEPAAVSIISGAFQGIKR